MKHFILLFIIMSLISCFGVEPQKTGKEGKYLPDFKLLLTDSSTKLYTQNVTLDKPIVLFYFSPYCPHCKAQTKTIIENIDNLKDIQFFFISNLPLQAVIGFYKEYQLVRYSNIVTGVDSANFVSDYFEIPGYPYIAIYGKDKKLNKSFLGKIYSSQIKKVAKE
jgi:thiol-disulfide isomerase/thioredoxin